MKYEVRPHPHSPRHLLFVVNTRGRVFACASAWERGDDNPPPSTATVEYAWKHARHWFLPYDESTGSYCAGKKHAQ